MKHFLIIPCVIVAFVLVSTPATRSCPVRLAYAGLIALGAPHGTAEYELSFARDKGYDTGPFTVNVIATMADKSQLTFDVAGVDLKSKFQMAGGKSTVPVFPFAGEVRSFQVVSARDWRGVSGCSDVAAYTVGDGDQLTSVSFDDGPHSEWPINSVGTIDIVDASFANRVQPNYPTAALNDRVEGDTTVIVAIDPNGSLAEASIYQSSGSALLDQASLDAAKQTTFKPAHLSTTLGGGPIRSVYLIIYTFHPAE